MLLGLLVAFSWGGMCLALACFAAFLLRRPFRVARSERKRRSTPRGMLAQRFLVGYALVALASFATALWLVGWIPLVPLVLAIPFLIIFLLFDIRNESRSWQAELAGPAAFSFLGASLGLAAGWPLAFALSLSALLLARAIPTVLYIRSRIRLERSKPNSIVWVLALHAAALLLVVMLVQAGWTPWLVIVPFAVLLVRAVLGLSSYRGALSVQAIGIIELVLGVLTIGLIAVGYWRSSGMGMVS